MDRREISYLRFIFESYDGVAVLTTADPRTGIVVLHIAPDCLSEADMIIRDLKADILIEELPDSGGKTNELIRANGIMQISY